MDKVLHYSSQMETLELNKFCKGSLNYVCQDKYFSLCNKRYISENSGLMASLRTTAESTPQKTSYLSLNSYVLSIKLS